MTNEDKLLNNHKKTWEFIQKHFSTTLKLEYLKEVFIDYAKDNSEVTCYYWGKREPVRLQLRETIVTENRVSDTYYERYCTVLELDIIKENDNNKCTLGISDQQTVETKIAYTIDRIKE